MTSINKMTKVPDIFKTKKQTFSFELFPPKTEIGYENLLSTIKELSALKPDFISCTYGAGGGNRQKTFDIVELIQKQFSIPAVAHLTCVLHTKDEIKKIIEDIQSRGVQNIMALRGDPPQETPNWIAGKNNFKYSSELCAFIREHFGDYFGLSVAGFPEGHILCKNKDKDAGYLKKKIDAGADFVITQFFFDNQYYFDYVARLRKIGVTARVIPGILPITSYEGLLKFTSLNGSSIPQNIKNIFEPIKDNKEKIILEGIKFAISQCKELLHNGAPGLHFYTLNKLNPTKEILRSIR